MTTACYCILSADGRLKDDGLVELESMNSKIIVHRQPRSHRLDDYFTFATDDIASGLGWNTISSLGSSILVLRWHSIFKLQRHICI